MPGHNRPLGFEQDISVGSAVSLVVIYTISLMHGVESSSAIVGKLAVDGHHVALIERSIAIIGCAGSKCIGNARIEVDGTTEKRLLLLGGVFQPVIVGGASRHEAQCCDYV